MNAKKKNNSNSTGQLTRATPARIQVGRAGTRPTTEAWLKFRSDHAIAQDSVHSELSSSFIKEFVHASGYPFVQTLVQSKEEFVLNPPLGKKLDTTNLEKLEDDCPRDIDVQIVVSDGLSAMAVEANVPDLLPMIEDGCSLENLSFGKPVFVKYGRVAVADQIGHLLKAKLAVNLIGERPGLSSGVGLSAYMTYNPGPTTISSCRTVVSNISVNGTPPTEAGAYIIYLIKKIFEHRVSGVELQKLL